MSPGSVGVGEHHARRRRRGTLCATRVAGGRATTLPRGPGAPRPSSTQRPSPPSTTNSSSTLEWWCGRRRALAGLDPRLLHAAAHHAQRLADDVAQRAHVALTERLLGHVLEAADRRRPRVGGLGLGQLQRARGGLGVERVRAVGRDPVRAGPERRARGSQVSPVSEPLAKASTSRPSPAPTIVCASAPARCRMTSPARTAVDAPVLPAEALAAEDDEQLLLVGVDVDGHRSLAGLQDVAAEAQAGAAGDRPEPMPGALQRAAVDALGRRIVPVADHRALSPRCARPRRGRGP